MPYLDPEERKKNAAVYREKNRLLLRSKQRARYASMTPEQRDKRREKEFKRVRDRKAEGVFNYESARKCARQKHDRLKDDPQYKEIAAARAKLWYLNNKERARSRQIIAHKRRMEVDVKYRLAVAIRRRLHSALKKRQKGGHAIRELGCSIEHFKAFIEDQFRDGMSWENWGLKGWHLDHIKPLALFDLSVPEQFSIACHYTNYQPLWAIDNIRKGAKPHRETWDAFYDRAWQEVI